ncbi:UNVERIFIED_CONTAM: hypothetical protein FKN15_026569 [Acipenser sinensis]
MQGRYIVDEQIHRGAPPEGEELQLIKPASPGVVCPTPPRAAEPATPGELPCAIAGKCLLWRLFAADLQGFAGDGGASLGAVSAVGSIATARTAQAGSVNLAAVSFSADSLATASRGVDNIACHGPRL